MSDKPSYLGLLNAISVAESEAACYLNAWAAVTPHDGVRSVISAVALREGEHGLAFAKRMCELGYSVVPKESTDLADKMAIASSCELSDKEKFERLGLGRGSNNDGDDVFAGMLKDKSIDIQTGGLLGRYIAEERDSGRMLAGCYDVVCTEANGAHGAVGASGAVNAGLEARLGRIEELLDCLMQQLSVRN